MSKLKNFAKVSIRKITGGKDPLRLVEEFITRLGFSPDEVRTHKTSDSVRWLVVLADGEELEILVEGVHNIQETTIYLGVNSMAVPIRHAYEVLAAALEIADGLIGIKVSLVGHYLVLSASLGATGVSLEDIEYHYKLITAQRQWFKDTLAEELDFEFSEEEQ